MFIYLSKKIAIPNNTKLKCLAWNKEQGFIACGGEDGLLKVLNLNSGKEGIAKGLAAPSNLSMNQTLEGHSGQIQVITWNETHQKLTSSDSYGLIIVWMLYKGSWYEEMINNRNKSVVRGMAWTADGQKICIVYEDGAVIVGSVDGNRIWGKELKAVHLMDVEWSPDAKLLLFAIDNGEVHVYDNSGGFVSKLNIQCLANVGSTSCNIVGLHWYSGKNGHIEPDCPVLATCYDNGRMQIMKNENDDIPILVDVGMTAVGIQWNHNGSIIAVVGMQKLPEEKECNMVQFYTPFGEHLRTLKVPGKQISGCAWEGTSLRIALAVDSYIYFANIRPDYKWCYFANTVVYSFTKPEQNELSVMFWNINTQEYHVRQVRSLIGIAAAGDHCVMASRLEDGSGQHALVLCNAIGTPIDSKYVDIEPICVAMTSSLIFAASRDNVYVWQYGTLKARSTLDVTLGRSEARRERIFHVDDTPSGTADLSLENRKEDQTNDPICCMTCSDTVLVVGRESGVVQRYTLPHIAFTNTYRLSTRPYKLQLNSNSRRMAIIDVTGLLTLLDLEARSSDSTGREVAGDFLKFDRKDVWDLEWASDNPELFAIMEKTRMYIFRNLDPEEPISSAGYICSFKDLEIIAVLLDEIMLDPDSPSADSIVKRESKSLRDTRDLLEKVGIKEAAHFVEENPHPRLWGLLAEAALQNLDLETAESAFVRCRDYPGIQFTKKLQNISSETLRKAEVAAYFKQFDEAERLYLEVDRRDLAITLRRKLGDYFHVVQLLKAGTLGTDSQMVDAWNNLGDYFYDRQKWKEAAGYYEQAANQARLMKCYYMLEDYAGLDRILDAVPDDHELLPELASMFQGVGMCEQAVRAYTRCGQVKKAVDCCVSLSRWQQAVELARKHDVKETSELLAQFAQHLLAKEQRLEAVELFRKASQNIQAAQLIIRMAEDEATAKNRPSLLKKMYVLAAILVDEHRAALRVNLSSSEGSRSSALLGLDDGFQEGLAMDANMVLLENPWRGAEAYHFYMMAQRQLYEGYVDAAMKTALLLRDYEDILPPEDIYCLLALSSCANRAFATCSKAFIKLESLPEVDPIARQQYEDLAMEIFVRHTPKDSRSTRADCPQCQTKITDGVSRCTNCNARFPVCTATGRPLYNTAGTWACVRCRHRAMEADMAVRHSCPLCHAPVNS
ncbi:unnamed protein product [Darwinula stevensoni]|uniref:WD repeat-containing protein 35 n=1 Tax=Darwinula stevensoni TaxID=69355 RepID=A0A7R8WZ93_9CRUS|nr:unnamed protein product [Darwinula stevensoni]CAG0879889.1 unnamed protein product [Darwinula stevensoni]